MVVVIQTGSRSEVPTLDAKRSAAKSDERGSTGAPSKRKSPAKLASYVRKQLINMLYIDLGDAAALLESSHVY